MARRNHKVAYFVWFMLFIGIAGFLFSSANADKYFTFQIQPNALADFKNIELPNVLCITKVTTEGFDKDGNVVLTEQSRPFEKHPITTYSLIGGKDNSEVVKFEITPKIRCEVEKNIPMTITVANLKAFVLAKDSKNTSHEVWNHINVAKNIPIVNNHEEHITTFTVNTIDLFKYLEKGQYHTLLTYQVTGDLSFVYNVAPKAIPYNIHIPRDSIQTYVDLDVTKDTPAQTPSDDDTRQSDPNSKNINTVAITDDLQKLSLCVATVDVPCLTQQSHIPYYIGALGLVCLIGAVTTKSHPVFDSFGNRLK